MSTHATHSAARTWRKGVVAVTASGAGVWLALTAMAAPASAVDQPEPTTPVQSSATVANPGPPNYPNYAPRYEVPRVNPVEQGDGLDTTSVALGALGGIALAGAGLGITLGVQRRHDHTALHTAR